MDEVDELIEGLGQVSRACLTDRERRFVVEAIAALRAFRKDRERLDWLFGRAGGSSRDNGETWEVCMYVQCRGEMDGDMLCPPLDLRAALDAYMASEDAAMAAESARGDAE